MFFACVLNWCTLACSATQRTQTATTSFGIVAYKSAVYSIQRSHVDDAFRRKIIITLWIRGTYAARRKSVWSIHEWNEWTLRVCNVCSVFRWGRAPNAICRTSAIKNNLTLDANSTLFFLLRLHLHLAPFCLFVAVKRCSTFMNLFTAHSADDGCNPMSEWMAWRRKKNYMMRLRICEKCEICVIFSINQRPLVVDGNDDWMECEEYPLWIWIFCSFARN